MFVSGSRFSTQKQKMSEETESKAEYFSQDFEWETLKQEVETNPSYTYHLLPFTATTSTNSPQRQRQSEDSKAWQRFHLVHSTGKFFKERRYLLKEFPELVSCEGFSKVLEVGCGNGSTVIPILRGNKDIVVYACDCSNETVQRAKQIVDSSSIVAAQHRFHPFCCDFAFIGFPKWLFCDYCRNGCQRKQDECFLDYKESSLNNVSGWSSNDVGCCIGGVDFVTLIFTLSAVPFERMPTAIRECLSVLKPGGLLLFRDYGLYDMTMLRFESDKRVGFREYMRSDGTHSYFFSLDITRDLFVGAGFIELELEYCCIQSVNRRKGKQMQRIWVHGKFQKPVQK